MAGASVIVVDPLRERSATLVATIVTVCVVETDAGAE
jgi:hypothetical protein